MASVDAELISISQHHVLLYRFVRFPRTLNISGLKATFTTGLKLRTVNVGGMRTDLRFFGNGAGVLGFFGVLGSFLATTTWGSFLGSRFGVSIDFLGKNTFGEAERDFFFVLGVVVVTVFATSASLRESSTETGESGTISADFRLRRLLRATFGEFSASFLRLGWSLIGKLNSERLKTRAYVK